MACLQTLKEAFSLSDRRSNQLEVQTFVYGALLVYKAMRFDHRSFSLSVLECG